MMARLFLSCSALAMAVLLSAPLAAQSITPLKKPTPAATDATARAKDTASTTAKDAAASTAEKKPPSEAQLASRARMKECGAEWQSMKKAGTTKGKTWRQFSSDCLKKK